LVTVGMAHVGYDHKPIAVATVLNGVREYNWLDQFTMRAGRMLPNRPKAEQTAWIFGMNDLAMRQYVNDKRNEASRAIKVKEEELDFEPEGEEGGGWNYGPNLIYNGISVEGISGIGFDHDGYLEELDAPEEELELLTDKEKREQLRRRRQALVGQYAGKLYGQVNGDTIRQVNGLLLGQYGKPVNQCSIEELERQIRWLEKQIGPVIEAPLPESELEEDDLSLVQGMLF